MSTVGPQWAETTAIFGGTFDPPHLGHREAVAGLFRNPGVKRVLVVPSAVPPQKSSGATSSEHRVEMTRRCFEGLADVELDLRELTRAQNSPKSPTYSFDTLAELGREQSPGRLAFVIGADQLAQLHQWHRFPELLGLCHWIVLARRPGGDARAQEALKQWAGAGIIGREGASRCWQLRSAASTVGYIQLVATDAPEISSTGIRETIARSGRPPEGQLGEAVLAYLMRHRLYGSDQAGH